MPLKDAPQIKKQHAVPQNIMEVEFKLIGELTMRQFTYLAVFLGLGYAIFKSGLPTLIRLPLTLILGLLGIGFAFVPIEDRGLDEWIVNFFNAIYSQNQLIWKKKPLPPSAFIYTNLSMVKQELITLAPTASRRKLKKYLELQNKKGYEDPYEQKEMQYVQKVQDFFKDFQPTQQDTVVTTLEPIIAPALQDTPEKIGGGDDTENTEGSENKEIREKRKESKKGKKETEKENGIIIKKNVKSLKIKRKKEDKKPHTKTGAKKNKGVLEEDTTKVSGKTKSGGDVVKKDTKKLNHPSQNIYLKPITPDRHTGRIFTNLAPDEGTIILPIRGEKVIEPALSEKESEDINEKAEQLKNFIQQIESQEKKSANKIKSETTQKGTSIIKQLEKEKNELITKIEKLERKLKEAKNEKAKQETQKQIKTLKSKQNETKQNIQKLKKQVTSLEQPDLQKEVSQKPTKQKTPSYLKPEEPNTIAGIIKDPRGRNLEGVLLVIKNEKQDPIRAIKTNSLGEFAISNPVPGGKYTIEIDTNNSTNFNFDIINFEAKGEIIEPMIIIGK